MRFSIGFIVIALSATLTQAQCRIGSAADQGDSIPNCSQNPEPYPHSAPQQASLPAEWPKFDAAVAWVDSQKGSEFTGFGKLSDEQAATIAALGKCRAKGWKNCTKATSVLNGAILVTRHSGGNLRTRMDASKRVALAAPLWQSAVKQACRVWLSRCSTELRSIRKNDW